MKKEPGNKEFYIKLRELLNPTYQTDIEFLYDYSSEGERRWSNLVSYFEYMYEEGPKILMIGEAPGYRGTSITGMPFLSEETINTRHLQKARTPYHQYIKRNSTDGLNGYEATSKFMWDTIDEVSDKNFPLLWASLPNHPHEPNDIHTNRKPKMSEIKPYGSIINMLEYYFAIDTIVSVGNVAYNTLQWLGYNSVKIRHPARGGVKKFKQGYELVFEDVYG